MGAGRRGPAGLRVATGVPCVRADCASYTTTRGETAWAQQACPLLNLWPSLSMQGPKEQQGEIRKHSSAISAKK